MCDSSEYGNGATTLRRLRDLIYMAPCALSVTGHLRHAPYLIPDLHSEDGWVYTEDLLTYVQENGLFNSGHYDVQKNMA